MANSRHLEVLFSPAEFDVLPKRDLSACTCVVFDVLRATSSMVTALANGATGIIPAADIAEAVDVRRRIPDALLAGERDGLRIRAELSGGVEFDLGNSPREFTREKVGGRCLAMTTTNGTRALRACASAQTVLIGSLLNLHSTAEYIRRHPTRGLLLVCGGTFEEAAYEDTLAAGALADLLGDTFEGEHVADSALIARRIYDSEGGELLAGLSRSRNGRRLLSRNELAGDVAFCAQRDAFDLIGMMQAKPGEPGLITRV